MFYLRWLLTRSLSLLAALACASPAFAIDLVRDINQQTTTAHSLIQPPLQMGSLALFIHDDGVHGRELWATDGTAAGTRLVRDINPGLASGDVNSLTVIGDVVYFWADDGTNGTELWRSDGTEAGTRIVVNIGPGSTGFGGFMIHGVPIQTLDGVLYFSANDGTSGIEPWRSDGTAAGTYRLFDVAPGGAHSEPENFLKLGSRLFFNVRDPQGGSSLWTTDGTVSGTRRVTTAPANASLPVFNATVVNDVAFVAGGDSTNGSELWRIHADGTASLVADLNTFSFLNNGITNSSTPRAIIPSGDGVLFIADTHVRSGTTVLMLTGMYRAGVAGSTITKFFDSNMYENLKAHATISGRTLFTTGSDSNSEFWTTDGTLAGTVRVRPNDQALVTSLTSNALVHGDGEVFFYARHGNYSGSPTALWRSDGTLAGTREYWAPPDPFIATELVRLNGRLYFPAGRFTDPGAGGELWTTDGTPAGTQRVADINPGSNSSNPQQLTVVLGRIFFTAEDGQHGYEPYLFDGTNAVALGDLSPSRVTGNAGPNRFTRLGNGVLFLANDGLTGLEPWYSDGTGAGTQLVRDILPGEAVSVSTMFQPLADFVLFGAHDGVSGRELWRTDGTHAGTYRVADIAAGTASSDPNFNFYANHVLNDVAYFSADDGVHGRELWRSDGTSAGTYMVTELTPGAANSHITPYGVANGRFIFLHQDSGNGNLWATDGTPAGTAMINTEVHGFKPGVSFGNYLYFAGESGINDTYANHLWRTDGTSAGTERVSVPGATRFITRRMREIQAGLVVDGCPGSQTCGLYLVQGASGDVSKLTDVDVQSDYVGDDSQLFFLGSSNNQLHLYRTDGTVAGTGPLLPGFDFGGSVLSVNGWFQGWLFFTVNETARGPVIWRTNGTAAGTRRFADMDPGIDVNNRSHEHVVLGTKLLFDAFRPEVGTELFAISSEVPNAEDDSVQGPFNAAITSSVLDNDTAFTGALNPGSLEIIVAPRFGTASVNATTGAITYTPQAGFSGADSLVYQVRDDQSRLSNQATLWMTIAANVGSGPGNAPSPPPSDPPPSGGGGNGGGGTGSGGASSGGGGSADWLSLMLLSLLTLAIGKRRATGGAAPGTRERWHSPNESAFLP